MATLKTWLHTAAMEQFGSLTALGVAMAEAGSDKKPTRFGYSRWFRPHGDGIPRDELLRLLEVCGKTLREAAVHMDDDDLATYSALLLADPETGRAFRAVMKAASPAEAEAAVREAERRVRGRGARR